MKIFLAHLYNLFLPHPKNNHQAHLIKPQFLALWVMSILVSLVSTNIFFSDRPQVLGFSTNIDVEKIISLTNQERKKMGLTTLKENPILDQAAVEKAKDMISKNYWNHFAPDGTTPWYFFGKSGYQYSSAGENLARDFYTNDAVVSAWMNSPTHRENILSKDYQDIGIGVVYGKLDGKDTVLIVQLFGSPATGSPQIVASKTFVPEANNSSALGLDVKIKDLGVTQKTLVTLLSFLALVYLLDLVIIYRRKIYRANSHSSLLHFTVIVILIFSIVLVNKGGII